VPNTQIRALLIEDNPGDARLIQEYVAEAASDLCLHHAGTLAQGLQHLEEDHVDVVLLDLGLPDGQGLDNCRELLAAAPTVPIVVLTGLDDESVGIQAMQAGAQDYLVKGQVDGELLVRAMRYSVERMQAEEALRESERALSTLMSNLPGMAYRCQNDEKWTIFFVSEGCFDLTGYEPGDLLHNRRVAYADLIHPDDRQMVWDRVQAAVREERPFQLVYRIVTRKGEEKWVWEQGRGVGLQAGTVHLEGFITDITERVQAEKDLLESTALMSAFGKAFPDLGFIITKEGRYVEVVTQREELLFTDTDGLRGKLLHDILPEDKATAILASIQKTIATGDTQKLEYALDFPDGSRWLEGRTARMDSHAGEEERVVLIVRDITDRKQAEEALRKERDYADRLVETAPAIILTLDPEGRIVQFNRYMEQISGYRLEEVQGQDWFTTFLPERDRDRIRKVHSQALTGTQTTGTTNPIVTKDGRECEVEWYNTTRKDADGSTIGMLSVGLDVTERRRAEATLQQHAARLETLHGIDQAILAAHSPEEIAATALRYIRQLVSCERASLTLFDFESDEAIRLAVDSDAKIDLATGGRIPLSDLGSKTVENLGKHSVTVVDDLRNVPQPSPLGQQFLAEGLHAVTVVGLLSQGEVFGSLNLARRQPGAFSPDDLDVMCEVADQLAVALQQAQLREDERQQRAFAEALADSTAAINSSLTFDDVLERILDNVGRVVPHDAANIMLIEEDHWNVAQVIRGRGYEAHGPAAEKILNIRYPIVGVPTLRLMNESEQPLVVTDTQTDPNWLDVPESRWVGSYAGSPIRAGNKIIGFLNVESAAPDFYTAAHAERLAAFADQAASAIQNAQAYQAEHQQRVLVERLSAAATTLSSSLALEDVLGSIFDQLRQVVSYDSATLQQLEGRELVIQTCAGFDDPDQVTGLRIPLNSKFPCWRVVKEGAPLTIADVTKTYPHFRDEADVHRSGRVRSWLGVPLLAKDQVLGIIVLNRAEVRPFNPLDVELVTSFSSQVAVAIENAQLYQELEAYSQFLMQAVEARTAELQREKSRVETILQSAGDAILTTDLEGRVLSVNPAFEAQTGYASGEIVGEPLRSLGSGELSPEAMQDMRKAMDAGEFWRGELTIRCKDDATYEAEVFASPLHEAGGELQGYVGVIRDITAQKDLDRMKDAFVSNVSHELRTPITGIKLFLGLLESAVPPKVRDDILPTLRRETNRLNEIIEDVLRLSRLDQGRIELNLKAVDLNTLAEEYATDRGPLAEDRGLSLTLDKAAALPPVQADAGLLGQALSALLTNALNYTPSGGQITISTRLQEIDGKPFAGVGIGDTGPGIPPAERDQLFNRFFRGSAARASSAPGTGLGLSIAQEIVTRHGGRIELESEGVPGKGTTFTVWLPVKESISG